MIWSLNRPIRNIKSNSLLLEAVPNTTPNLSAFPAVLRLRGALAYKYQFGLG